MIFYRNCELQACLCSLEENTNTFALHLKLSPNICYSQESGNLMPLPDFEPIYVGQSATSESTSANLRSARTFRPSEPSDPGPSVSDSLASL